MLISKIRQYSWLAVGLIALCLIGFLVQDATNSNTGMFRGNKAPDYATMYGEEVNRDEVAERSGRTLLEYLTLQTGQVLQYENGSMQLDPQTKFGLNEQSWTEYVNEKIIDKQLEELGLGVTEEELTNLIYGPDPHPYIKNYYIGLSQTGTYDASLLPLHVKAISDPETQKNDPSARQAYYNFICREQIAKRDYRQTKYMSLFSKAAYVPEWMAKRNYTVGNTRRAFRMVSMPYAQIADSTIVVNDKDLETYYNKNKNKYKQTEGRTVEYVSWDFIPSPADSAATVAALMESVAKMKTAKSDSAFIATRSEDPDRFGNSNYSRQDLYTQGIDSAYVDSFFVRPAGSLIGPFQTGEYYKVATLKSRTMMPDSVKSRHILVGISEQRDSIAAKKIVDSLMGLLNAGGDFTKIAGESSDDQSSAQQGGDLGWTTPSINFVPEIKDYLFKTGSLGKVSVVKSIYGYHIIEITEMRNKKEFVNVAFLSKSIGPGKETVSSIEKMADDFYAAHQDPESFEQGVIDEKLFKRTTQPLTKSMFEVPGLPNSREIITWAYESDLNEFKYFNMTDRVVVAYLKEIRVNGVADLEYVRDQVEQEVILEKKAEILTKKINEAMGSGATMESIASKLGVRVDSVLNASMATPSAPILGREPKVIGAVFASEQGKITAPISGLRGVYVAQVFQETPAPEQTDFTMNKNQLTYSMQNKFQGQGLLIVLKERANVVDNRYIYGD